ncbi:MAG: hypothetical protein ACOH1I_00945 [Gallionellaceae bacterium]|jgi:hypothetical protein
MKKIAFAGATLALTVMCGSAMAANSLVAGTLGVNIAFTDTGVTPSTTGSTGNFIVSGKYFMTRDLALIAGAGLGINGGDAKGNDIGFTGGIRKYLKTDDFAPFVGARLKYTSTRDANLTAIGVIAEAGAEYFISRQFSLEGRVGLGYESVKDSTANTTATRLGTESLGLSANFYF